MLAVRKRIGILAAVVLAVSPMGGADILSGLFFGKLPCADCTAVDTKLQLKKDGTYQLTSKYMGKDKNKVFVDRGKWEVKIDGEHHMMVLTSTQNEVTQFMMTDNNHLAKMDAKGRMMTSAALVRKGQAKGSRAELRGRWMLLTLGEAPVSQTKKPAFIEFNGKGAVTASAGCNVMRGKYEGTGQGLKVGPMASTRMMCAPEVMEAESKLTSALRDADGWRTKSGLLELLKGTDVLATLKP